MSVQVETKSLSASAELTGGPAGAAGWLVSASDELPRSSSAAADELACAYAGALRTSRHNSASGSRVPRDLAPAAILASALAADSRDDLLCRIVEIVGGDHVETRSAENGLAFLDVGAFEADHQRHLEADLLDRGDHAFGDHVAAHDAAEDVDQDAFDVGIGGDDLEGRGDLLLARAAADIEEVRRLFAIELDDVHGGHRKPGAVDHAPDIAVECDVSEVVFVRLDLLGVFLGDIAQFAEVRMPEQGVVVEAHLGVEQAQVPVLHDDQRVDLEQAHVGLAERLVERREHRPGIIPGGTVELECGDQLVDVLG